MIFRSSPAASSISPGAPSWRRQAARRLRLLTAVARAPGPWERLRPDRPARRRSRSRHGLQAWHARRRTGRPVLRLRAPRTESHRRPIRPSGTVARPGAASARSPARHSSGRLSTSSYSARWPRPRLPMNSFRCAIRRRTPTPMPHASSERKATPAHGTSRPGWMARRGRATVRPRRVHPVRSTR